MPTGCVFNVHAFVYVWLCDCVRVYPPTTNTILLCLVCPKAIITLFVCTALSLSLVIHFYKYSISLTSSRTPTFQKTISPPVTLFISWPSYELFFLFNYHAFLFLCFTFLNVNLGKIKAKSKACFGL